MKVNDVYINDVYRNVTKFLVKNFLQKFLVPGSFFIFLAAFLANRYKTILSNTGSDLDLLSMGEFVRFVGSCGQDRERLIRRVILGRYPILRPVLLFLTHKHAQIQTNGMIASNDSHSKCDGQVHATESVAFFME